MRDTIEIAREVESDAGFQWCVNFIELARFEYLVRADERKIVMSTPLTKEMWQRFEDEIRADEREACAKVCAEMHLEGDDNCGSAADAIRARGEIK
jgi:hypothetical protein